MNPKISVILPVYNVEKYISRCIQSILNQTYTNFELIVVDDGSPDKSINIAESFTDNRIKIFKKTNGGLSDARNFGLSKATGEYIYFIDSDDWIENNLLEKSLSYLLKHNSDFIIFGYFQDNEDKGGKLIHVNEIIPEKRIFSKTDKNLTIDSKIMGIMGYAWNKLYRKKFIDDNNLKFEKGISLIEDILFNSKVYALSEKIVFLDKAFYHYINRPNETLIKKSHSNSFELILLKKDAIKTFLESWNVQELHKLEILAYNLVQGFRYTVYNLFNIRNATTNSDKIKIIRKIITHPEMRNYIKYYLPISIQDKIYKFLIKNRMAYTIFIISILLKKNVY